MKSVIRQNIATNEWVLFVKESWANKPDQYQETLQQKKQSKEWEEGCPFCPGHEDQLEETLWQHGDVKVVKNKYPVLSDCHLDGQGYHYFDRATNSHLEIAGRGAHEVVIESSQHHRSMAHNSVSDVTNIFRAFQSRGKFFAEDKDISHMVYLTNHGERGGGSLIHPHSQIAALPIVPLSVQHRMDQARWFFKEYNQCVFCKILNDELLDVEKDGSRVIDENDDFVGFIPYCPITEYNIWIMPKQHNASFLDINNENLENLGKITQNILRKLYDLTNDGDYNLVLRSSPIINPNLVTKHVPFTLLNRLVSRQAVPDYFHWYLELVPRLFPANGFTFGTGLPIVSRLPEAMAQEFHSI